MSRYIDANRLMKYIDSAESISFGIIETKLVRDLVNDTPAADVVEVVRCRDCIHLKMKIGWGECDIYRWSIPYEDHYCGYGKRREDEVH